MILIFAGICLGLGAALDRAVILFFERDPEEDWMKRTDPDLAIHKSWRDRLALLQMDTALPPPIAERGLVLPPTKEWLPLRLKQ